MFIYNYFLPYQKMSTGFILLNKLSNNIQSFHKGQKDDFYNNNNNIIHLPLFFLRLDYKAL
jgi:hypothetical protein